VSAQPEEIQPFDGLVTFFASLHAMRAEKTLQKNSIECRLIPGPREISPHCGVALQLWYVDAERATSLFQSNKVQIEAIHQYRLHGLGAAMDR